MRRAGFTIAAEQRGCWPALPLPRGKLDRQFRDLPDVELLTRTAHVLLTK
jgi:hypothetical protein